MSRAWARFAPVFFRKGRESVRGFTVNLSNGTVFGEIPSLPFSNPGRSTNRLVGPGKRLADLDISWTIHGDTNGLWGEPPGCV
jgi:hypothetical protein